MSTRTHALINYTTEVSVEKSVSEIQAILVAHKAKSVMCDYDGDGNATEVAFRIDTSFGRLSFILPANVAEAEKVLNQQVAQGKIPKRFQSNVDQARRIAWRIVKQWIEAQMAFIQLRQVTFEQAFLQYAQVADGQTLYEQIRDRKFSGLALMEGTQEQP